MMFEGFERYHPAQVDVVVGFEVNFVVVDVDKGWELREKEDH